MPKALLLLIIFCCTQAGVSAQKQDNIWVLGKCGGAQSAPHDEWGVSILDFSGIDRPQVIEKQEYAVNFTATNASICDSSGHLQFYTNGEKVYGPNHQVMENGGGIALTDADGYGYRLEQGAIALPYPGHARKYILITVEDNNSLNTIVGWNLFYHVIDMAANNGLGKVVEKRKLLVQDTLAWGKLTAVKHANGRDWWFVIPRFYSGYYVGLLDASGLSLQEQFPGGAITDGLGQAAFSADGKKYIRVDDRTTVDPTIVSVMDFDRCTGQLSNFQSSMFAPSTFTFGAGVAVSPDSHYLYVTNTTVAYQYDLQANDLFATQTLIAQYDGFISYNYPTDFWIGQSAPDGRIYFNDISVNFHLHYIDHPNRSADVCGFIQHGLELPTVSAHELPNYPNYRLGPLDGSSCDTLGLDNHPLANWRWEQADNLAPLQVTFTDLSNYEPASWYWDFGDGQTSQDTSPVHTYAIPGIYQVCLMVSNTYSSDTLCRALYLGVSATDDPGVPSRIKVVPNPFRDRLSVVLNTDLRNPQFRLYDQTGRLLRTETLVPGVTEIGTTGIPPGLYIWEISSGSVRVKSGKCVKVAD